MMLEVQCITVIRYADVDHSLDVLNQLLAKFSCRNSIVGLMSCEHV